MGDLLLEAGLSAANTVVNTAMGLALEKHNDRRQLKQNAALQEQQLAQNAKIQEQQINMWKNTGPVAMVEEYKKAGLNPALMYGMNAGAGGQLTNPAPGGGAQGQSGETMAMLQMGLNRQMTEAQIALAKAQAAKAAAEADKTRGIDTEEARTRISNNIAQNLILEYAGKEAKDQYELIKKPWRDTEARTWGDELWQRALTAQETTQLIQNGRLKEMSDAQLQQLLTNNAKTAEEKKRIEEDIKLIKEKTKGQSLQNVITEAEGELAKNGISVNSPWYIKMFGYIFQQLLDSLK